MADTIKSGVVVRNKFIRSGAKAFRGYIEYIDREEAIRNDNFHKFNLYQDYMGNPEKSTGLFTADKDRLSKEQAKDLKGVFQSAQDKGSIMWQTVISFDMDWLQKYGLYDKATGLVSEGKVMEAARNLMNRIMQEEGLQNAVWSGSIHYNTDNIHVHTAMVEPEPMREVIPEGPHKGEVRGKIKGRTIKRAKAEVVSTLTNLREQNIAITGLIRNSLTAGLKTGSMEKIRKKRNLSRQYHELVNSIAEGMPDMSKTGYSYNSNQMNKFRGEIDSFTENYMSEYYPYEYEEMRNLIRENAFSYGEAYGKDAGTRREQSLTDLFYERTGNALLSVMREDVMERRNRLEMTDTVHVSGLKLFNSFSRMTKAFENECSRVKDYLKSLHDMEEDMSPDL